MLKLFLTAGPWGLWNYPAVSGWLKPFVDDAKTRALLARALLIEVAVEHDKSAKHIGPLDGLMPRKTRGAYLRQALSEVGSRLGGASVELGVDVPKLIAKFGYESPRGANKAS